jgi:hypothetical protein
MALKIGRFYERFGDVGTYRAKAEWDIPAEAARSIAKRLNGKHIVKAVPSFDDVMLKAFLRKNGHAPTWHYHLIDVETLVPGALAQRGEPVELPWKSDDLSRAFGGEPPGDDERHTALGDARWAKRLYEAVMK